MQIRVRLDLVFGVSVLCRVKGHGHRECCEGHGRGGVHTENIRVGHKCKCKSEFGGMDMGYYH
ncbi:hypothetical protein M6B38_366020 [Iris pallida]|uniref:Uncharacterized protein n=1 Tax=Iris pallida TaxID=29817 RepID=A0AAX6GGT2_IRIPA|nr:hypothetical protein M6B38_366020 [Iris pallida]